MYSRYSTCIFLTAGSALTLTAYILARKGIAAVKTEWLENALPITVAGLLTFAAYELVLTAFYLLGRATWRRPERSASSSA